MGKWDLVIFDLDGTLLDTIDDLGTAVNVAMSSKGFPLHSMEEYRRMVGHGVRNLVTQAMPSDLQSDESIVDECLACFKTYYTSNMDVKTHPYPGMVELVRSLYESGVKVAVASNKFQSGTESLVRKFFPGVEFSAVLGNREGAALKPDARIVLQCMEAAGASKERTVMVGDSRTDMQTAINGEICGIAVSWGFRPASDMEGMASAIADSPADLFSLLGLN